MIKSVFFVVSSLGAGGSERVFWLLTQYFAKSDYKVSIVILNDNDKCFSTEIEGVNFIDLKTGKASKSFFSLYRLLKKEKPYAVFSTTDHINILISLISVLVKIPCLIARVSNNIDQFKAFSGFKDKFYSAFHQLLYPRFDFIVCQSDEMKQSFLKEIRVIDKKIRVIPNPVLRNNLLKNKSIFPIKRLIIVARLSKVKGIERLIDMMKLLPDYYHLTIAGDGPIYHLLESKIKTLKLESRIKILGQVNNVTDILTNHDLMVLSSFTEGFPNAVLEALAVGLPVVSYRVGGISDLIINNYNGFIIEQNDRKGFLEKIIYACSKTWEHESIKLNTYKKYELNKIGASYELLLAKQMVLN